MLIRPRTDEDVEGCVAVMWETHRADAYPRYWPGRPAGFVVADRETDAWVAEVEGRVVGQAALHAAEDDPVLPAARRATGLDPERLAVLARFFVSPSVRGTGVGRALLQTAVARAHTTGRRPVLDVQQESWPAIRLYEAAGFVRLEPLSLDLSGLGYTGVPPLQLWVYLGPDAPATTG